MSSDTQQHVIFGAGLIGGYVGAMLTHQGLKVSMIVRPAIQARWQNGITLSDYQGNASEKVSPVLFSENWQQLGHCDVLWLTVKCTGVQQAAAEIAPLVGPDTLIICCQNGLGSDQILRQHYPNNPIIRAMIPFNVIEQTPAQLHRGSEGAFTLELGAASQQISNIASLLQHPLMPVSSTDCMTELLWAKLQLNMGNAVNALADIPVKHMLLEQGYRQVLALLMEELLTVAKAKGLALPKLSAVPASWLPKVLRLPNWLFRRLANKMLAIDSKVRTSMWWDLHHNRATEIDYLNGALVAEADALGIPCPANRTIITMIKQLEQTESKSAISAPALLQAIKKAI